MVKLNIIEKLAQITGGLSNTVVVEKSNGNFTLLPTAFYDFF